VAHPDLGAGSFHQFPEFEHELAEGLLVRSRSKGVEAALLFFDPSANPAEPPASLLGSHPSSLDLLDHTAQFGMAPVETPSLDELIELCYVVHAATALALFEEQGP